MFDASSKRNHDEGRASSHLELVERAGPLPGAVGTTPLALPKTGFKLGWKMKTLIGTALVVNGLSAWVAVKDYQAKKAAENKLNSATPLNSAAPPNSGTPPTYDASSPPPPGFQPNGVSHLAHRTQLRIHRLIQFNRNMRNNQQVHHRLTMMNYRLMQPSRHLQVNRSSPSPLMALIPAERNALEAVARLWIFPVSFTPSLSRCSH